MPAFNFTSWGYQDCQFNTNDGSYGGMLTKLLFRTLPDHYPAGSAYAHFPFVVPKDMKDQLAQLPNSPVGRYSWKRPPLPGRSIIASSYQEVGTILVDEITFQSGYDKKISNITNGIILYKRIVRYFLAPYSPLATDVYSLGSKAFILGAIYSDLGALLPVYNWPANQGEVG
jgi:linoleate 10R-lipoxygenase